MTSSLPARLDFHQLTGRFYGWSAGENLRYFAGVTNMNSIVTARRLTGTIFLLIAIVHIWRLVRGIDVMVGSHHLPMWLSVVGAIVTGLLGFWLWTLSSRAR